MAQIIGWIIWGIVTSIALVWAYGCRVYMRRPGGVTIFTLAQTLFFWVIPLLFLATGWHKLHMLWVTPLSWLSAFVLLPLPIIGHLLRFIVSVFGYIVGIGIGYSQNPVMEYIKLLGTENSHAAISELADIGEAAIEPLMPIFKRPQGFAYAAAKGDAIVVLTLIGEPAVKYLTELLGYEGRVRFSAAKALGKIGNKDGIGAAVGAMLTELRSDYALDRESAVRSLGDIAEHLTDAALKQSIVETLISASNDEDSGVRRAIAMRLGGIRAEEIIPTLEKLAMDDDEMVRDAAQHALKIIRSNR